MLWCIVCDRIRSVWSTWILACLSVFAFFFCGEALVVRSFARAPYLLGEADEEKKPWMILPCVPCVKTTDSVTSKPENLDLSRQRCQKIYCFTSLLYLRSLFYGSNNVVTLLCWTQRLDLRVVCGARRVVCFFFLIWLMCLLRVEEIAFNSLFAFAL